MDRDIFYYITIHDNLLIIQRIFGFKKCILEYISYA